MCHEEQYLNQNLLKTIPVTPPTVNRKIKPNAKSIDASKRITPPHIVAIQLKILIPVGTAITIVAAVKISSSIYIHTNCKTCDEPKQQNLKYQ